MTAKTMVLRVALAALLLAPAAAMAQPGPGGPGPARAKLKQRIQQVRVQLLQTEVGLDEASARKAAGVIEGFDTLRRGYRLQQKQARERIEFLLQTDSKDMGAFKTEVAKMRKAHIELQKLRVTEFDALTKVLTPRQSAQLILGLERVKRKLRRRLRKARQHMKGRRGGGPRGF